MPLTEMGCKDKSAESLLAHEQLRILLYVGSTLQNLHPSSDFIMVRTARQVRLRQEVVQENLPLGGR